LSEKRVAKKTSQREKKSDPERPIPVLLHVDFVAPIRRIHL
jgi:hypothetical protein